MSDFKQTLKNFTTGFFFWWSNQKGTNAHEGYDSFIESEKGKELLFDFDPFQFQRTKKVSQDQISNMAYEYGENYCSDEPQYAPWRKAADDGFKAGFKKAFSQGQSDVYWLALSEFRKFVLSKNTTEDYNLKFQTDFDNFTNSKNKEKCMESCESCEKEFDITTMIQGQQWFCKPCYNALSEDKEFKTGKA